jgi:SsrA-binding protein
MSHGSSNKSSGQKLVTENRRARRDYEVLDTVEAGLALVGTEVKSLRDGQCSIAEAYIRIENGQASITGMTIPVYSAGNIHNHEPDRERKLLLHKREIVELEVHVTRKGNTLIPLKVYFTRGRAKVLVGIVRGRHKHDKRQAIVERDTKRQLERELKIQMR